VKERREMIHVITSFERVPKELVEEYKKLTSATVYEASGAKGALSSRIKPISPDMFACGTAVTVKIRPKDNLMLHKAIYVAQPGDVIVADAEGFTEAGAWGEIMAFAAQQRGIAGLVFNGGVRDSQAISALGFPVFSASVCIRETEKISLGLINHPLNFDNQTIHPGDLILGDRDGVVVVKREEARDVLKKSLAREEKESGLKERIKRGETTLDMFGFGEILKSRGLKEEI
jgi:4-hydroxy-4-methyl-2-oxoglutarate aldolase